MGHRALVGRGMGSSASGLGIGPDRLSRRKSFSLNNNRNNNNNNRRRGRGNRPQQGGGNQNRIDSRARGNAPQMLDKYKKLAQDAQHHGDRVQAEYYLQFADHYFRVIADNRVRQDEARGGAPRDYSPDDDNSEEDEFDPMRQGRDERPGRDERQRDERPRDDRPRDDRPREDRSRDDRPRDNRPRDDRNNRGRDDSPRGNDRQRGPRRDEPVGETGSEASGTAYEPADNPFVRGNRDGSTRRPRRDRANEAVEEMVGDRGAIDAAALPPAFSVGVEGVEGDEVEAPRKPAPRRRRKVVAEDGAAPGGDEGEPLKAVG